MNGPGSGPFRLSGWRLGLPLLNPLQLFLNGILNEPVEFASAVLADALGLVFNFLAEPDLDRHAATATL